MLARPPYRGETSTTLQGSVPDASAHHPQNIRWWATYGRVLRPVRSRDEGHDASGPSDHRPITLRERGGCAKARDRLPPRDETIRPHPGARRRTLQKEPLNRDALNGRLAPPTVPQRTTDQPEQPVERGEQESQTSPEKDDTRVDEEPLSRLVADDGGAGPVMREPMLGARTARVVERARKRNTITKTHFQSNLSSQVGWYVAVSLCHAISHNVNSVLLQHSPNLLNILLIHASNANAALDLTVTVLKNFDLKRDTVQAKNDLPAQ